MSARMVAKREMPGSSPAIGTERSGPPIIKSGRFFVLSNESDIGPERPLFLKTPKPRSAP